MEEAGQRLKRVRENLRLRYRDVEEASQKIALRHDNDEFAIALSRLADIENKGMVPSIYRLYSLCVIYRLDLLEVLSWYGVDSSKMSPDTAAVELETTQLIGFRAGNRGEVPVALTLDPGLDVTKTTYLSRLVQRWGTLPLMMLEGLDPKHYRYALIGTEDWSMYPIIPPGALVVIDDSRRKIVTAEYQSEFERPVYFLEHRDGYTFGWCNLEGKRLIVQAHPTSGIAPSLYAFPEEIDVLGQLVGIAISLDPAMRRRTHF